MDQKSAYLGTTQAKMYHNLSSAIPGHSKTTLWIYDSTLNRVWGEARSYSGGSFNSGSLQQLYAAGKYTSVTLPGEVYDSTKYQGCVVTGSNAGWFNLNASGVPSRSTGWHKFEIEVLSGGTTINFYVDGILGRQITGATAFALDDLVIGSLGTASTTGDGWFDDIKIEYYDAPTITTQPNSQSVSTGANVTFSVVASGVVTSYQWYKNAVVISGATSSSLVLNNVQSGDAGSYYVIVANGIGPVTSTTATLTVTGNTPPSITTQPQSQTVNAGTSVTFSVVASGTAPLSYQWRKNTVTISGATASSYTISSPQSADAGSYSVVITNVAGSVTSADAVLTVHTLPSITTQPSGQMVNQGSSATFSVVAAGDAPLSYQWRFNAANISGATLTSYTKSNCQSSDAGSYSVVVTNSWGSVTSANAVLVVNTPPTITTQPASQTVAPGTNVTYSVVATGTAPLSYQWRLNQVNISGATTSSYTRNNVQSADIGYYSVVITNAVGTVTSADAGLTINNVVVFIDTFESGNLNNWTNALSTSTVLTISTAQNHTSGGVDSALEAGSLNKMFHNLGSEIEAHSKLIYWGYDADGSTNSTGQTRWFAEPMAYSGAGYTNGSLQQKFAIGRYNVGFGTGTGTFASEVVSNAKYQGRVVFGSNTGWFNLTGSANRSVGWHKFEIERLADGTTINFIQDGVQGRQATAATAATWDSASMGSIGSGTGVNANAWFDDVSVDYYDLPTITTQPSSQTVTAGSNVTFSVVASGNIKTYQWRFNGVNIAGATASSYTINGVTTGNAGNYTVVVCNGAGPITSNVAVLTVN